jgi:hypothetical protein
MENCLTRIMTLHRFKVAILSRTHKRSERLTEVRSEMRPKAVIAALWGVLIGRLTFAAGPISWVSPTQWSTPFNTR